MSRTKHLNIMGSSISFVSIVASLSLSFTFSLSTALAQTGGDVQMGASAPVVTPKVDSESWIDKLAAEVDRNKNPVLLVEGVGIHDNTARLPEGHRDAAHALERDVLREKYDVVISLRNGRFEVYEPEADRTLVPILDPKGKDAGEFSRGFRKVGESFSSLLGANRQRNGALKEIKALVAKLNDGKSKDLPMDRKLRALQTAIEPIVLLDKASVAFVVRDAASIMPKEGEGGRADKSAQAVAEHFRDLSTRFDYAGGVGSGKPFTTILMTETQLALHPEFLKSADFEKISAGLPSEGERSQLLDRVLALYPEENRSALEAQLFSAMDRENFLRRTHGMDKRGFLQLLQDSVDQKDGSFTAKPMMLKQVKASQEESIIRSSNGMIVPLDVQEGLSRDVIVGSSGKRTLEWMDAKAELVRQGKFKFLPYFFLVGGPPGTGKTFPFEVIAGEDNFPLSFYVIKFDQANSKWVGELGKNLAIIRQIALEAPPGTVFLFDEIIATLAAAKGEGAGASAINEFRKFIRELAEDFKGKGKMIGFMDSRLGFEVARINAVLESDELSRATDRLVVEPVFAPEDKFALLDSQLARFHVSEDDRLSVKRYLDSHPEKYLYIVPTGRYIEDLAREFASQRSSVLAETGAIFESVLGDFVPPRDSNWYAKWVASWMLYNPRDPMPTYVKKWFQSGKLDQLKTWIKEWEFGGRPVTNEQLSVLLAPSFEGHEKVLSGTSGDSTFPGMPNVDDAEMKKQLDALRDAMAQAPIVEDGAENPAHVEDPESLGSSPARSKKVRLKGRAGRCDDIARGLPQDGGDPK